MRFENRSEMLYNTHPILGAAPRCTKFHSILSGVYSYLWSLLLLVLSIRCSFLSRFNDSVHCFEARCTELESFSFSASVVYERINREKRSW